MNINPKAVVAPGLKKVISEVTSDERDICLFIDELSTQMGFAEAKFVIISIIIMF